MKSQRRHELQENEIAKVVKKAPGFWEDSGSKYLAGAVVVLVIVVLIRYHLNSNRQSAAQAVQNLSTARSIIDQLSQSAFMNPTADPRDQVAQRREGFNEANQYISDAMRLSDDHKIEAEALLAKGDLSWELAALPPIPGAATQPALEVRDPKELLDTASQAYQTVVSNYSDQRYAVISARLGLAALAENRHDWGAARSQYQAVIDQTKDMPTYSQLATNRLSKLDQISKPVYLAAAATEPAVPPGSPEIPPLLRAPPTQPALTAATQAARQVTAQAVHAATKAVAPAATKPK